VPDSICKGPTPNGSEVEANIQPHLGQAILETSKFGHPELDCGVISFSKISPAFIEYGGGGPHKIRLISEAPITGHRCDCY